MQVNIDYIVQQKILNDPENSFSEIINAEELVLQQLNEDVFLRFLRSPEFKEYLSTIKAMKNTIDKL